MEMKLLSHLTKLLHLITPFLLSSSYFSHPTRSSIFASAMYQVRRMVSLQVTMNLCETFDDLELNAQVDSGAGHHCVALEKP
jgi:hypothetical protein